MSAEAAVLCGGLAVHGGLLLLLAYHVITLSDLECDYLNPVQCCRQLNACFWPRLLAHALLSASLLLQGSYYLWLWSLPLLAYLLYERACLTPGSPQVYDPLTILNRAVFSARLRDVFAAIGYYLTFFFVYLYYLIVALLKGDPLERHLDDAVVTEL